MFQKIIQIILIKIRKNGYRDKTKTSNLIFGGICSQWKHLQILPLVIVCTSSDQSQSDVVQLQRSGRDGGGSPFMKRDCTEYDLPACPDLNGVPLRWIENMPNYATLFTLYKLCDLNTVPHILFRFDVSLAVGKLQFPCGPH